MVLIVVSKQWECLRTEKFNIFNENYEKYWQQIEIVAFQNGVIVYTIKTAEEEKAKQQVIQKYKTQVCV